MFVTVTDDSVDRQQLNTPKLIDQLGFNGTFSTNRLYRASEKYVAVKK